MSTRAECRKILNRVFTLDADLDSFLIDYFPNLSMALSRGMSRTEKLNLLLSSVEEEEIRNCLVQACPESNGSSRHDGTPSAKGIDDAAPLRKEVSRLQQIIKDLEQQLSGQKFDPTIHAKDGLERLRKCIKEITVFLDEEVSSSETHWTTWGHNALDSLESALGRFHNISCAFRFHFYIAKEPPSERYLALLRAAETILQQQAEETDRAVKSLTRSLGVSNSRRNRGW